MALTTTTKTAGKQLEDFVQQVEDWLTDTEDARLLSERDRDYKDGKQWTDSEMATLKSRNQAPIVVNRIHPKVEGLKGLLIQRKTDPKAFPRTQKHTRAAEAVTDGLRFVADNVNFDQVKLEAADNVFVEGYGGAIIEQDTIKNEIKVTHIPWDRYYYDVHSRRLDFKDKRYDGIVIWMYTNEIQEAFNLTDDETESLLIEDNDGSETFDDRPLWIDRKKNRARICQHFYLDKGVWMMVYFAYNLLLTDPAESPYVNEDGIPMNPIETQAANIDRENNRFGEVRYWIDLQDEMNHRRSKFLHLLNNRQTMSRKGAIDDVPALKRELSKADGHVEYKGEKGDFDILGTSDMAQGQINLYEDGKRELDAVGFNAQLSGERQGDLSGKAVSILQQAAITELSGLYNGLAEWEKRVYRQVWCRIKQFWNEEKWIRVTDDQSQLRWVGFNQKVTTQILLEERAEDESLDPELRLQAATLLQDMLTMQDPRLQQIQEVRNDLAELDVDILIELSLDTVNIQQEQFELFAKLAQTGNLTEEIIELSTLRHKQKDKLIKMIQARQQAASQQAQAQTQLDAQESQAKAAEDIASAKDKEASANKKTQEAIQTSVQTNLLLENPPKDPSVVI